MGTGTTSIALFAGERSRRSFAMMAVAALFVLAQLLFAAHAASPVDDLKGHSAAECVLCLAGGVADDTANGAPSVTAPVSRIEAVKTAIPAALLIENTVRAASPRAPPAA